MTAMQLFMAPLDGRGRLEVRGKDRERFLQGMLTSDVAKLGVGESERTAFLTSKGRVVADFLLRKEEECFLVDMDPELREKVRAALDHFIVMDDVNLVDVSETTGEVGLYGPGAGLEAKRLEGLRPVIAPLGLHGIGARERTVALGAKLAAEGVPLLSEDALEAMRIEQGISRYGKEISEETLPMESELEQAVSYTKGCFIGQEPLARVAARGHINKKIIGLLCDELLSPGDILSASDRPDAGVVTSAVVSSNLGRPIALGYVHRSQWEPGTELKAGAKEIKVVVSALPFIKWNA